MTISDDEGPQLIEVCADAPPWSGLFHRLTYGVEGSDVWCYVIDGQPVTRAEFKAWLERQDDKTRARLLPTFNAIWN